MRLFLLKRLNWYCFCKFKRRMFLSSFELHCVSNFMLYKKQPWNFCWFSSTNEEDRLSKHFFQTFSERILYAFQIKKLEYFSVIIFIVETHAMDILAVKTSSYIEQTKRFWYILEASRLLKCKEKSSLLIKHRITADTTQPLCLTSENPIYFFFIL